MTCADPTCRGEFTPRSGEGGTPQLYCSQRCMRRVAQRRYLEANRAAVNKRAIITAKRRALAGVTRGDR